MLKGGAIPLYYQLETILRNKILSGEMVPGQALPSEKTLIKEYGVSRITVRQALLMLERDGLILRKRGKGSFLSRKRISFNPLKYTGSLDDLTCVGIKTNTKVLDTRITKAPKWVTDRLDLPEGNDISRIERLRLADGIPYCYILNYLPVSIGQKIQPNILLTKPLMKVLEEDLGISLIEAVQTFEATVADTRMASILRTRVGYPLLKIDRTTFSMEIKPVELVSILYRADKYLFRVQLKRDKTEKSSNWNIKY